MASAEQLTPARRVAATVQLAEIQRSRLLVAAVQAVDELGYSGATVAHITSRARVSRRTFYELFANREQCLAAVLDEVIASIEARLAERQLGRLAWRERIREGLWTILCYFDREPVLARVCLIHAQAAGAPVLGRRGEILDRLVAAVDEGRREDRQRAGALSSLTAEGLVGAAFAIAHARLLKRRPARLRDLHGELMGMFVLPYHGAAAARREQERPAPQSFADAERKLGKGTRDPLDGVPMRLTYRTARVLEGIGARTGLSNREVADYAGIADQGQVSRLLARLERLQLLANEGLGHAKGEPNAWRLTARGELVARGIAQLATTPTNRNNVTGRRNQ